MNAQRNHIFFGTETHDHVSALTFLFWAPGFLKWTEARNAVMQVVYYLLNAWSRLWGLLWMAWWVFWTEEWWEGMIVGVRGMRTFRMEKVVFLFNIRYFWFFLFWRRPRLLMISTADILDLIHIVRHVKIRINRILFTIFLKQILFISFLAEHILILGKWG